MMLKAPIDKRELGMTLLPEGGARFLFWSPQTARAGIEVENKGFFPLEKKEYGYHEGLLAGIEAGDRYMVVLDGKTKIPDPASLYQSPNVHSPSEVIDLDKITTGVSGGPGRESGELIIYELHTGTFTPEGTFEGVINKLDYLSALGINAIELMPVAQFPGTRNWGYDGVYPFAVQNSYGGPEKFARLVDECHKKGIAVILDVVYNHLGPEGNYLYTAGPYFTDKYKTPWGSAVNFDDKWCDGVRRYFTENALMWLRDYGVDGLRLDAVHAIWDFGARHFIEELSGYVSTLNSRTGNRHFLIGECDLNDVRYITPLKEGGLGLDCQWCDEFHHALHARLTGERMGYYSDFGATSHLANAYNNAYVYNGRYSEYRKRVFGSSAKGIPGNRFVVFTQNHDQAGNRMLGERLSRLTCFESLKLAAGAMFVSPYIPMLFMGEEYGEDAPFLYFTSHSDKDLVEAVRKGRKEEFADFISKGEPADPQSPETFKNSMLSWNFESDARKDKLLSYYKKLIELKKTHPALKPGNRDYIKAVEAADGDMLIMSMAAKEGVHTGMEAHGKTGAHGLRSAADAGPVIAGKGLPETDNPDDSGRIECRELTVLMNFSEKAASLSVAEGPSGSCHVLLYSAHTRWGGPVSEFASLLDESGSLIMEPRSIIILSD